MSNRLKRRKAKKNKKQQKSGSASCIHVETPAGSFLGEPRGSDGWMVLQGYQVNPNIPPEQVMQQCGCPDSGETYTKPFEHKYMAWPKHNLLQLREELFAQLTELNGGVEPLIMVRGPLWLEVEFIENILSFELRPPRGCAPKVALMGEGRRGSEAC